MNAKRWVAMAAVVGMVVGLSGCMTTDLVARAQGNPPPSDPYGPPYQAQPGYYLLVPLAMPLDLITFPIQFFQQQQAGERSY